MGKRYKSVIDLVEDIIDDEEFKEQLKKNLQDKSLAHKLYGMRCAAGITQTEMAKKMGCDQSRISKLENAGLDSIKTSDLIAYSKALNLHLVLQFKEAMSHKQAIRYDIIQIMKKVEALTSNDTISCLFNGILAAVNNLPNDKEKLPTFEIQLPVIDNKVTIINKKAETLPVKTESFNYPLHGETLYSPVIPQKAVCYNKEIK